MDARKTHEKLQQIYRAVGKLVVEFEQEFQADEDRARVEAEYNRISAERNALENSEVAAHTPNTANPATEKPVPVIDGVKSSENVKAEGKVNR